MRQAGRGDAQSCVGKRAVHAAAGQSQFADSSSQLAGLSHLVAVGSPVFCVDRESLWFAWVSSREWLGLGPSRDVSAATALGHLYTFRLERAALLCQCCANRCASTRTTRQSTAARVRTHLVGVKAGHCRRIKSDRKQVVAVIVHHSRLARFAGVVCV